MPAWEESDVDEWQGKLNHERKVIFFGPWSPSWLHFLLSPRSKFEQDFLSYDFARFTESQSHQTRSPTKRPWKACQVRDASFLSLIQNYLQLTVSVWTDVRVSSWSDSRTLRLVIIGRPNPDRHIPYGVAFITTSDGGEVY